MNILALLFPIICYGIYSILLYLIPQGFILFDLYIALSLGIYVVIMKHSQHRRLIACVHSAIVILMLCLKIDVFFLWVYQLGGLSIALTRHNRIQPLCPLPKTRMIIMTCIPLFWVGLVYLAQLIPFSGICLAYTISGVLMGFYLWMKERLNEKNRQLVTQLTTCFMLVLSFWLCKEYQYMWIIWALYSQIIQLFRVKFI